MFLSLMSRSRLTGARFAALYFGREYIPPAAYILFPQYLQEFTGYLRFDESTYLRDDETLCNRVAGAVDSLSINHTGRCRLPGHTCRTPATGRIHVRVYALW